MPIVAIPGLARGACWKWLTWEMADLGNETAPRNHRIRADDLFRLIQATPLLTATSQRISENYVFKHIYS